MDAPPSSDDTPPYLATGNITIRRGRSDQNTSQAPAPAHLRTGNITTRHSRRNRTPINDQLPGHLTRGNRARRPGRGNRDTYRAHPPTSQPTDHTIDRTNFENAQDSLNSARDSLDLALGNLEDSRPLAPTVTITPGEEAASLLQAMKADPNISLFVKYKGSVGIDQDGLSRQALQLAYTQLLTNENGVADKQESEGFQLRTPDDTQLKQSSSLDKFHDFGLLASHIAKVPMGAGYDLDPNSFEQMHTCFSQLIQTGNQELLLSESSSNSRCSLKVAWLLSFEIYFS